MYRLPGRFSPMRGTGGWFEFRISRCSSQLCWTKGTPPSPAPPSCSPPPNLQTLSGTPPFAPPLLPINPRRRDVRPFPSWPPPSLQPHSWSHLLAQHQGLQFLLLIQLPISTCCSLRLGCSSCPLDPLSHPTGFSSKVPSSEEPPRTNQLSHQHPEPPLHTSYPGVGWWLSTHLGVSL